MGTGEPVDMQTGSNPLFTPQNRKAALQPVMILPEDFPTKKVYKDVTELTVLQML